MDVVRDVFSVVAVFVLLGGALWALRRGATMGWRGALAGHALRKTRSLEAVERMALTPQHSLHLVRINGRELVVATHPQGCALLLEIPGGGQ